jgi:hypothetical protein
MRSLCRDRFEGLIPIFWRRIAITAANPPRSWFDARRAHALQVEPGVFRT